MSKKEKPVAIATWEAADDALREIGQCRINVQKLDTKLKKRLLEVKREIAEEARVFQKREAELTAVLDPFWRAHAKEVAPAKSRKLNFGTLGQRAMKSAVKFLRGFKAKAVVTTLEAAGDHFRKFLRFKASLNKDAIRDATPEELSTLTDYGIRVEAGGEKFYAEPDLDEIRKAAPDAA